MVGIFMSVVPEAVRAFGERGGPGDGCGDDVAMVSLDRIYRMRPTSTADQPVVLKIIAETRAEHPREAAPAMGEPSHCQEAALEPVTTTTNVTVYLAATETEAVGSRPTEEPWLSKC